MSGARVELQVVFLALRAVRHLRTLSREECKRLRLSMSQLAVQFTLSRECLRKYVALMDTHADVPLHELLAADSPYLPKRGTHHPAVAQRRSHKRTDAVEQLLRASVSEHPERYLDELQSVVRERAHVDVSLSSLSRWLRDLNLPRKRASRVALPRVTPRVQDMRTRFAREVQPRLPSVIGRLMCVDESHVDERSAQRLYARAPRGERAVVAQPYNGGSARAKRITLLCAVAVMRDSVTRRLRSMVALRVHTGSSCTRAVFMSFIQTEVAALAAEMRKHNDALCLWPLADDDDDDQVAGPPLAVQAHATAAARVRKQQRKRQARASAARHVKSAAPASPAEPVSTRRSQRHRVVSRRNSDFVYDDDDAHDDDDAQLDDEEVVDRVAATPARVLSPAPEKKFNRARAITALVDNWTGHRSDAVLAACGTHVSRLFIPPYSPDFNLPIEGLFGDVKRWLRRHHYWDQPALTTDVIERAVRECANNVAAVLGRFKHAGYKVSDAELAEARAQQDAEGE